MVRKTLSKKAKKEKTFSKNKQTNKKERKPSLLHIYGHLESRSPFKRMVKAGPQC